MKTPRRSCRQQPNHVLCLVTDAHNCHPMTEELIDTWWNALAPEAKAEIYEAALDAEPQPSFTACGVTDPGTLAALAEVATAALETNALRSAVARGEEALRVMLDLAGKGSLHA